MIWKTGRLWVLSDKFGDWRETSWNPKGSRVQPKRAPFFVFADDSRQLDGFTFRGFFVGLRSNEY
jgi:hypothetical protein